MAASKRITTKKPARKSKPAAKRPSVAKMDESRYLLPQPPWRRPRPLVPVPPQ